MTSVGLREPSEGGAGKFDVSGRRSEAIAASRTSVAAMMRPPTHEPRVTSVTRGRGLVGCPSWARTRTLLIQSQACCQLHQGAENCFVRALNVTAPSRSLNPKTFRARGPAETFRRDSDALRSLLAPTSLVARLPRGGTGAGHNARAVGTECDDYAQRARRSLRPARAGA